MFPEWPEVGAIRVLPKANPFSYLSGDKDTDRPILQALCLLNLLKRFSSLVEHLLCFICKEPRVVQGNQDFLASLDFRLGTACQDRTRIAGHVSMKIEYWELFYKPDHHVVFSTVTSFVKKLVAALLSPTMILYVPASLHHLSSISSQ